MPSCCELPKSQLRLVTASALALLLSPLCSCMSLTICPPNFFFLWCLPPSFSHSLQGYVGPSQEQVLKVFYLPGVPGAFCRTFQIQVGHLEPETITLKGEGSFPRICLDLPRNNAAFPGSRFLERRTKICCKPALTLAIEGDNTGL